MPSHLTLHSKYNMHRASILYGGDYKYSFYMNILASNRQIFDEASSLFARENRFIRIISSKNTWTDFLDGRTLSIARGGAAITFPGVCMNITLGQSVDTQEENPNSTMLFIIIEAADLPDYCTNILRVGQAYHWSPMPQQIRIDILSNSTFGLPENNGGSTQSQLQLRQLLAPLKEFHSMEHTEITGLEDDELKTEIISALSQERPSGEEVMEGVLLSIHQGEQAVRAKDLSSALEFYKDGLRQARGKCYDRAEINIGLGTGSVFGIIPYEYVYSCLGCIGEKASIRPEDEYLDAGRMLTGNDDRAWENIMIRLQARVSAIHLELNQFRMARIHAARAYDSAHGYDMRHNPQKFPLNIDAGSGAAYSEVLIVAAKISYHHCQYEEALEEIEEAVRLFPLDEEHEIFYQSCRDQVDRVREKRNKVRDGRERHFEIGRQKDWGQ